MAPDVVVEDENPQSTWIYEKEELLNLDLPLLRNLLERHKVPYSLDDDVSEEEERCAALKCFAASGWMKGSKDRPKAQEKTENPEPLATENRQGDETSQKETSKKDGQGNESVDEEVTEKVSEKEETTKQEERKQHAEQEKEKDKKQENDENDAEEPQIPDPENDSQGATSSGVGLVPVRKTSSCNHVESFANCIEHIHVSSSSSSSSSSHHLIRSTPTRSRWPGAPSRGPSRPSGPAPAVRRPLRSRSSAGLSWSRSSGSKGLRQSKRLRTLHQFFFHIFCYLLIIVDICCCFFTDMICLYLFICWLYATQLQAQEWNRVAMIFVGNSVSTFFGRESNSLGSATFIPGNLDTLIYFDDVPWNSFDCFCGY